MSESNNIKQVTTLEMAEALHSRSPFDMIIADMVLLKKVQDNDELSFSKHPFIKTNPFVQFVVLCNRKNIHDALKAVEEGASGYLIYPIQKRDIQLLIPALKKTLSRDFELDYLRDHFWQTEWLEVIRSNNPRMKKVYENIRSVAPTIATVLLTGDTGTGKGMLARLIHWHSKRSECPFISVHCGAIPETLIESELFGHEKGSFTGADRRKQGKFEMAKGGTIFLDEIGTITPSAQIKILQVLQDGTFSRIGGESILKADVRIITATNANLNTLVDSGEFRKDLFYRLNIFPIKIPPLKERIEDLDYLIEVFLRNLNEKYGKNIELVHPSALKGFKIYDWPGNIRELENILERAYILENSSILMPYNFPFETIVDLDCETKDDLSVLPLRHARNQAIEIFESSYLNMLLEKTAGRINPAAEIAGITTRQLNRLLKRYNINKNNFKKNKTSRT